MGLLLLTSLGLAGLAFFPGKGFPLLLGGLIVALVFSLAACTGRQLNRAWRRSASPPAEGSPDAAGQRVAVDHPPLPPDELRRTVVKVLRRWGYTVHHPGAAVSGRLVAAGKHAAGCWGSPLLHLGLLGIIVSALVVASTTSGGRVVLIEGEAFTGRPAQYLTFRGAPAAGLVPAAGFGIKLEQVEVSYRPDGQVDEYTTLVTRLERGQPSGDRTMVAEGQPLARYPFIVYSHLFGYAPLVAVERLDSPPSRRGVDSPRPPPVWIALDTVGEIGEGERYEGQFTDPSSGRPITLRFLPHFDAAAERNLDNVPAQPALMVEVVGGAGEPAQRGLLPLRGVLPLAGLSLTFLDYRRWASFTVVAARGQALLVASFVVSLLGAALLYLLNPRRVTVWLSPAGDLRLSGSSQRAPHLFAGELEVLARRIGAALQKGKGNSA
jgi:hypothetical protein